MIDPWVFPLNNVKAIGGAVMFSTDVKEGRSGYEVRAARWQDSRRRFNATPGIRTLDHFRLVRTFHYACMGREIGFLLRDWSDYTVTNTQDLITGGGGAYEQGVSEAVGASTTVFQLQKLYSNGYRQHRRKVTRPQAGTVTLHNPSTHATITSGYTIDYNTGRATFTSAPGFAPNWAGSLYCPARFLDDEIEWDLFKFNSTTKKGLGDFPDVILIEDRE